MFTLATRSAGMLCAALVVLVAVAPNGAFAQEPPPRPLAQDADVPVVLSPNVVPAVAAPGRADAPEQTPPLRGAPPRITEHRTGAGADTFTAVTPRAGPGSLLTALYLGFAGTQALDAHSTLLATGRGARETNPLVNPFVGNAVALVAVKAGIGVGIVYMTERLRRHSRLGAIVTMVALNSTAATLAARNYRVAASLGP